MVSTKRILSVTKRVLRQISRDHRTFGMIIFMPIIIMFIFGIAFSGDIHNIPLAFQNADAGFLNHSIGANIYSNLSNDSRVQVTVMNFSLAKAYVDNGTYFAALLIPKNFTQSVLQNNGSQITIYVDPSKPPIQAELLSALQDSLKASLPASKGISFGTEYANGGQKLNGLSNGLPSVMAFTLTFISLILSLLILIRERTSGTMIRLYASPLTGFERLAGYIIALSILSFIMTLSIIIISIFVFNATIKGNIFVLLAATELYAFVNVLIAVVVSNFASNELQAVQMAPLISLPSMALSGMLVPIQSLPSVVQPLSAFVPLTYGINLLEGIMLKGLPIASMGNDLLALFGMIAVLGFLAIITVRTHESS